MLPRWRRNGLLLCLEVLLAAVSLFWLGLWTILGLDNAQEDSRACTRPPFSGAAASIDIRHPDFIDTLDAQLLALHDSRSWRAAPLLSESRNIWQIWQSGRQPGQREREWMGTWTAQNPQWQHNVRSFAHGSILKIDELQLLMTDDLDAWLCHAFSQAPVFLTLLHALPRQVRRSLFFLSDFCGHANRSHASICFATRCCGWKAVRPLALLRLVSTKSAADRSVCRRRCSLCVYGIAIYVYSRVAGLKPISEWPVDPAALTDPDIELVVGIEARLLLS